MFTGIVAATGKIIAVQPQGTGADAGVRLSIDAGGLSMADVAQGDSVAVNGACMTVTALNKEANRFDIEISAESLAKTHGLAQKRWVNLEKAVRPMDRLGGHMVSGHVDGTARVVVLEPIGESWTLKVLAPLELACYLAYKGSVTLNGVSLTINDVLDLAKGVEISINLIAHTLQNTTFKDTRVGDTINIEIDTVARYVHRALQVDPNLSKA